LRASYRSANAEAIAHLSQGMGILARLPESPARDDREIDLQLALGMPQATAKGRGSAEAMAAYARARELCDKLGSETSKSFPALRSLWTGHRGRGQIHKARELADRLLAIAERAGDQSLLLEAHHAQWTTLYCLGEWRSVLEHTAQGLALYRPEYFSHVFIYSGHDSAVCATAKEGISLWMLGFPDRALARAEESIALAHKLSHPPSLMHALFYATILHQFRRDATALREKTEARFQLAQDRMPNEIPSNFLQRALISALESEQQARAGMTTIQEALQIELSGDVEWTGFILCLFADVCELAGEVEACLNALGSAISAATTSGVRLWESELHRLAGNLLLGSAAPDLEQSEAHYFRAIEVAREQQARSLELRASIALARLWADGRERQKAYDLLAPVYAGFTEGFGTRDLIDAKALLDELD
jgi:predicted ATPase